MTLGIAVATRALDDSQPERNQVLVMADSRLTLREGSLDQYFKAVSLGTRSAAIAAGDSFPFVIALEGARPFVAVNARDRQSRGLPPLSVWCEATFVWLYLETIFDRYRELVPEARTVIVVAGFFSDNTPGLVRLERDGEIRQIAVFRPRRGGRSHVAVGADSFTPILKEAFRRSAPPKGQSFHDVASVLWDIMKHQGTPTRAIGGGLALGFAKGNDDSFNWPIIEIDGQCFMRGFDSPRFPNAPTPIQIEYDATLCAALEREHEESPFTNGDEPDDAVFATRDFRIGERRLFTVETDDSWLLEKLNHREVVLVGESR